MPKVLFNITYTQPKAPSYMKGAKRAEYQAERGFYNLTSEYNYFEYVLNNRKVERNKNAEHYYTRGGANGGLFDLNGVMSEEQVDEMKRRLAGTESIIWHGFISFDAETSKGIKTQENAIKFMRQTFGGFLKRTHLNYKKISLYAALHTDKAHHHHIHFSFFENEPNKRDKNGKLCYTKRGKIDAAAIENYVVSANIHLSEHGEEYYSARDRAIDRLKLIRKEINAKTARNEAYTAIEELRKELPRDGRLQYGAQNMAPYRPKIDKVAELLIASDAEAKKEHKEMLVQFARVKKEVDELICDNRLFYVDDHRVSEKEMAEIMNGEAKTYLKYLDNNNIDYFERLQDDYKKRVGNVILGICKDMSFRETYDSSSKNKNERIKAKNKARRKESVLENAVRLLALVDRGQKADFIKTVEDNVREQEFEQRKRA